MENLSLLIVEDNPVDQERLRGFIGKSSFNRAAIQIVDRIGGLMTMKGFKPDAIFLDLNLVDSNGVGTLKKIRFLLPNTPVIVVTTMKDWDIALTAIRWGAEDYIQKEELTATSLEKALSFAIERFSLKNLMGSAYELLNLYNQKLEYFSNVVSHDLNSNVATIAGLLNLIEMDMEGLDKSEIIELIKNLNKELSQKLVSLIDVLYEEEEGLLAINEDVNIENSINLVLKKAKLPDTHSGVVIEPSCHEWIKFNGTLLSGLLDDIVAYSVALRSPKRPLMLNFRVSSHQQYQVLEIRDNGKGMDLKNQKNRPFQMFKKLHPDMGKVEMGFYVVKLLMEVNGGKVEVISTLDIGTEVKLFFLKPNDFLVFKEKQQQILSNSKYLSEKIS